MSKVATPAELYGPLLAAVQERGILADGKTFVDAVPRRPVEEIMAEFERLPAGDEVLRRFIAAHFDLPPAREAPTPRVPTQALRAHIRATWRRLARDADSGALHSSALPVAHRHVVPGGRFREIYYWDSYFTMLGLVRDGEIELAAGMVDAMTDLIDRHGHVPNGARTYFLGRSQPPLFYMMVALLDDRRPDIAARRLAAMKREYAWWMEGAKALAPGQCVARVVKLADGSLLNRYWDARTTPRDESWREDVSTAEASGRPVDQVYRNLRAGAESGWDFSSRWLDDASLGSIRTTEIAPVDLNAFLFGLETALSAAGGDDAQAYAERAAARRAAMHAHLWDATRGHFVDFDLKHGQSRPMLIAAALAPLFTGIATREHAAATARVVENDLVAPGGLRTTLVDSGQQWDRPNGWAPLQWIAVAGLRRYGCDALAREIARRWIATVEAVYARTGDLYEKYDVENCAIGEGGEYRSQTGFGWTNGVTAALMDMFVS